MYIIYSIKQTKSKIMLKKKEILLMVSNNYGMESSADRVVGDSIGS